MNGLHPAGQFSKKAMPDQIQGRPSDCEVMPANPTSILREQSERLRISLTELNERLGYIRANLFGERDEVKRDLDAAKLPETHVSFSLREAESLLSQAHYQVNVILERS
jgi:hypothetical protein